MKTLSDFQITKVLMPVDQFAEKWDVDISGWACNEVYVYKNGYFIEVSITTGFDLIIDRSNFHCDTLQEAEALLWDMFLTDELGLTPQEKENDIQERCSEFISSNNLPNISLDEILANGIKDQSLLKQAQYLYNQWAQLG
ncbi:MAG: hypothetical protein ABJH98_17940 [Reichenbachiella sp.]|uniref:hypothetical protein n=1 Tax=Reichenbachiella sp. TaxID=2184521 RepID=UPI0032990A81